MPKPSVLFLALLLPFCLHAQRDSHYFKNVISVAPLRLADPGNSGIEVAYEYQYKPRLSTQLVAAYMTPAFSNTEHWIQYQGFRLGIDQRLYLASLGNHAFVAFGIVLNKARFLNAGMYQTATDSMGHFDTVHLHKTNLIFNLTYGTQAVLFRRFTFDFSSGIGIKYRQIKQDEPGEPVERETDWISNTYFSRPSRTWTAAFPVIIRLGYCF